MEAHAVHLQHLTGNTALDSDYLGHGADFATIIYE